MALALDGSTGVLLAVGPAVGTLTTTKANDIIVVGVAYNGALNVLSVTSSPSGLSFTKRATNNISTDNGIDEWYAVASSALASEVITVNFNPNTYVNYDAMVAFGVSGADTSTIFDSNAALPVSNTTGADPTFSTTNAATFVYSLMRFGTIGSPTAGAGWNSIYAPATGNFLAQYKIYAVAQSGATAAVGTGTGDENGSIVDALIPLSEDDGTAAITEGADTAAGVGTVAVTSGTDNINENSDTAAGAGTVAVTSGTDNINENPIQRQGQAQLRN